MSGSSSCGASATAIPPPPPTATSIIVDKSPTIVVATGVTNHNSATHNIVVGDLINSTGKLDSNTNHHQPIDLAQHSHSQVVSGIRTGPPSSVFLPVVPVGRFRTTSSKGSTVNSSNAILTSSNTIVNSSTTNSQSTSIISVNRTGLTILPTRVPFQGVTGSNGSTTTLQFARGTTILRPAGTLNNTGQPASITVTPIPGSNIRLANATVNNGSWLQTNNPHGATYTPIRPIQVGRQIRPDAKLIHIPQQGTVQHLTQLQVVDAKGTAILKPHLTAPIVRAIQTSNQNVSGAPITVPITQNFTIRTATLPNARPLNAVQKVLTQSSQGQPILVDGSKLPQQHAIQAITPIPRLLSSPVCLTIPSTAPLNPSNTAPTVAIASKSGSATNLILNPPSTSGSGNAALTKMYDVPLLSIITKNQPHNITNNTGSVTISMSSTNAINHAQIASSTNSTTMQSLLPPSSAGTHQLVQVHGSVGSLNVQGQMTNSNSPTISLNQSNNSTAGLYVGPKNINLIHSTGSIPIKPITTEKRTEGKSNKGNNSIIGPLILTATTNQTQISQGNHFSINNNNNNQLTIPIGPHTFAHPISIANSGSLQQQILTSLNSQATLITAPTISSAITSSSLCNNNSLNVIGGQQQSLTLSGHIIATPNASHAIPAHIINSHPNNCPVTTSNITLPSTTSVIVTTAGVANNSSNASSIASLQTSATISGIPCAPASSPSIIVSNPNTSTNIPPVPPVPSPSQNQTSQTKTTLSPRPSILRKRDAPISDNIQLRAQRNLAHNFGLSSANPGGISASNFSSVSGTISANKENSSNSLNLQVNNNNATIGLNFKKDFQPPSEEFSWQSCSSNSSSGSTTISATSETAEIQLQQQSLGVTIPNLSGISTSCIYNANNGINNSSTTGALPIRPSFNSSNSPSSQTSARTTNTPSGRSRLTSTSKSLNKDTDRGKCVKGKDDHVSPRKKPRKQQLTTSDLLESASSEISFYQGKRLKRSELLDPTLFQGFPDKFSRDTNKEDTPSPRINYIVKRPRLSLLEYDKLVVKTRLNHFQKYSDVKAKEEKKPTLIELANQKDVFLRIDGFKLQHLSNHLRDVTQTETTVVNDFDSLLEKLEAKTGPNKKIRDLNKLQELLKGNIQRCKVITDQMTEGNSQILKILEHKPILSDMLNKYVNKRPTKKRERL